MRINDLCFLAIGDWMNTGVIGNGAFGAVVDRRARIVWCCLDGFGGDPVFNSLLNNDSDEGGFFDVSIENLAKSEQKYVPNSAVLVTTLVSTNGDVLQVKDFAPRFHQTPECIHAPFQLYRVVTRIRGDPIATIRVRPSFEYNSAEGYQTRGSHHIRYCGTNGTLRLSTNAPIQLLMDESPFLVHDPVYLVFGQDESFTNDLSQTCREFEDRTIRYWKQWCLNVCLPVDYQEVLVRSALTLQLMQSDELGGLITSLTLGIPLGPDLPPTRDERVFHLLDACLSLPLLRDFGLTNLTRKFLCFLKSIAFQHEYPQAVYDYLGHASVPATELSSMAGYLGIGPTIAGGIGPNPAPDVGMYGLLIIGLSHGFFDVRLKDVCSPKLFERMEQLGEMAVKAFAEMADGMRGHIAVGGRTMLSSNQCFDDDMAFLSLPPDSSEQRSNASTPGRRRSTIHTTQAAPHTFTTILCWAAADRLARVAEHCHWMDKSRHWASQAKAMRETILMRAVSPLRECMVTNWGGDSVGPSLLRVVEIGFLSPTDLVFTSTIAQFETDALNACFARTPVENRSADWAGLVPSTPFQTSTLLWYAEALRAGGREAEARSLFQAICADSNEMGLVAESVDLKDGRHWGNFPHTPALLGVMRVGSRLSRNWRGV